MRKSRSLLRLATLSTFLATLALATFSTNAEEIVVDLRSEELPPILAPSGPMKPGTVFWEKEGLRVALPADRTPLEHVGARTRFGAAGDFEIVATCDLIEAPEKSSFFGSGARLFVILDSPIGERISLSRVRRELGGDCYLAYFIYKDSSGVQQEVRKTMPAYSQSGRLRIRRKGETLTFEAADDDQPFQEIHSLGVGTGDATEISVTGTTWYHPSATEVRWKELSISADALTDRDMPEPPPPSRFWYWVIGAGSIGIVIVAIPIGLLVGRRRPPRSDAMSTNPREAPLSE